MSAKIRLSILESDSDTEQKIEELIAAYPEFEVTIVDESTPITKSAQVMSEFRLTKHISEIFATVGIPANVKGYQYLREAIKVAIEHPGMINAITKELYPAVAKTFQTSPSKVERAIRHAVEIGWSRGKIENINNLFGVKVYGHNDKPTNGELIGLIADKLSIDSKFYSTEDYDISKKQ